MQGLRWGFLFAVILVVGLSLRKPVPVPMPSGKLHDKYEMPGATKEDLGSGKEDLGRSKEDLGDNKENLGDNKEYLSAGKEGISANKVNWLTLKQVEDSLRVKRKHILIDLYTEWCGWCKVMDKKTYTNANVADYLAKNFYAVKLDAETKREITWAGKKYFFNPGYRANDFSVFLTGGNLSYPTTVIIPADNGEPQPIPGYLEPKDFELIVKYFGEGKFGRVAFPDYQKNFKASW